MPTNEDKDKPDAPCAAPASPRGELIEAVLAKRQPDLTLVLDNIHDPHNVAAILRSCDAFGVGAVHLHYTYEAYPDLSRRSSGSARKWVEVERHRDGAAMAARLREAGYRLIGAGACPGARPLPEWDLTGPTAIVLGNEHRGIETGLAEGIEDHLYIPMLGMVRSLNVSVAAAIILYEAWRQREAKSMYDRPAYDPEKLEALKAAWLEK
jgi:tRNA (guanosine-2'-O-)-methyltransferase